jgi:hypothetical protein
LSHIEQVEFVCPQCRKRTIARLEEEVYCPKCDVPMNPQEPKVAAAAAANSPARSGTAAKSKSKSKTASKATKATGTKSKSKSKAAAAALIPDVPQVVVGDFRCACCGYMQTVQPGEKKPGTVLRCPSCFVKLEKVK